MREEPILRCRRGQLIEGHDRSGLQLPSAVDPPPQHPGGEVLRQIDDLIEQAGRLARGRQRRPQPLAGLVAQSPQDDDGQRSRRGEREGAHLAFDVELRRVQKRRQVLRGIEGEGSLSDLVPIRVSEIEPNVGRGRVWVDKGDGRVDRAVNRSEEDQRAACAAFSTLLALLDVIQ